MLFCLPKPKYWVCTYPWYLCSLLTVNPLRLEPQPETDLSGSRSSQRLGIIHQPRRWWSNTGRPVAATQAGRRSRGSQENDCAEKGTSTYNCDGAHGELQAN